jgi:hypothetical protein
MIAITMGGDPSSPHRDGYRRRAGALPLSVVISGVTVALGIGAIVEVSATLLVLLAAPLLIVAIIWFDTRGFVSVPPRGLTLDSERVGACRVGVVRNRRPRVTVRHPSTPSPT